VMLAPFTRCTTYYVYVSLCLLNHATRHIRSRARRHRAPAAHACMPGGSNCAPSENAAGARVAEATALHQAGGPGSSKRKGA